MSTRPSNLRVYLQDSPRKDWLGFYLKKKLSLPYTHRYPEQSRGAIADELN